MVENIVINNLRELMDRSLDVQYDPQQLIDRLQRSPLRGLWEEQESNYEMRLIHSQSR